MLGQKLVLNVGGKTFIQILSLSVGIVVARIVGPEVIGILAYSMAFVNMFSVITNMGLGLGYTKLVSEGQNEEECNGTFVLLQGILILIYIPVTIGAYLYKTDYIIEFNEGTILFLIFLCLNTIALTLNIPRIVFAAKMEQAKQDVPSIIQSILGQIFRLTVVLFGYKAIALALSRLLALIAVLPIYLYLIKDIKIAKFNKKIAYRLFNISIPVLITAVTLSLMNTTDKVILEYFTNTKEVGIYSAGQSLIAFLMLINTSAAALFFPLFSKYYAKGELDNLNSTIRKFERFLFIFVMPVVFYITIFSDIIIAITIGEKFRATPPILSILTLMQFIGIIYLPYKLSIAGQGKFYFSALIFIIAFISYAISAYIFVSPHLLGLSGIGMAGSKLVSALIFAILFFAGSKKLNHNLKILSDLKILLTGIIISVAVYLIYTTLDFSVIVKLVLSFFYFIIYWGTLWLLKIMTRQDINKLIQVVKIKDMMQYIKLELFGSNKK